MKLLLADDDSTTRSILRRLLEHLGPAELTVAVDGPTALDAVRFASESDKPYDLILLDIMMPVRSGHDVLRELRRLERIKGIPPHRKTKVIVVTALANQPNVVDAIKLGCNGYLIKPITRTKLFESLERLKMIRPAEE